MLVDGAIASIAKFEEGGLGLQDRGHHGKGSEVIEVVQEPIEYNAQQPDVIFHCHES